MTVLIIITPLLAADEVGRKQPKTVVKKNDPYLKQAPVANRIVAALTGNHALTHRSGPIFNRYLYVNATAGRSDLHGDGPFPDFFPENDPVRWDKMLASWARPDSVMKSRFETLENTYYSKKGVKLKNGHVMHLWIAHPFADEWAVWVTLKKANRKFNEDVSKSDRWPIEYFNNRMVHLGENWKQTYKKNCVVQDRHRVPQEKK